MHTAHALVSPQSIQNVCFCVPMSGEINRHVHALQISAALGRKPVISAGGNLCPLGVTTPGPPPSLVLGVRGQEGLIR